MFSLGFRETIRVAVFNTRWSFSSEQAGKSTREHCSSLCVRRRDYGRGWSKHLLWDIFLSIRCCEDFYYYYYYLFLFTFIFTHQWSAYTHIHTLTLTLSHTLRHLHTRSRILVSQTSTKYNISIYPVMTKLHIHCIHIISLNEWQTHTQY